MTTRQRRSTGDAQAHDPRAATVQIGYWVAVSVRPAAAPLRCFVGQVEAIDEHGIRLTLIDWLIGTASDWDFFAPWSEITSMLIATPAHDVNSFGEAASRWQGWMDHPDKHDTEAPLDLKVTRLGPDGV